MTKRSKHEGCLLHGVCMELDMGLAPHGACVVDSDAQEAAILFLDLRELCLGASAQQHVAPDTQVDAQQK